MSNPGSGQARLLKKFWRKSVIYPSLGGFLFSECLLVRVICNCELDPTNSHTMQTHAPEHLNALWTQLRVTTAVIFTITAGEIYSAIWQFLAVVEQVSYSSYPSP